MPDWSAAQYLEFEAERTRPARDLLAAVPVAAPRRVVDIGCGPGNSTGLLVRRWPDAEVTGLDSSPDMLEKARARLPEVAFARADARAWAPEEPVDVIFANAVFQWLPDHIEVMRRLMTHLAPGGALAVQMPDNLAEPSHRLMREAAEAMPFAGRLAGAARDPLPPPSAYYEALSPAFGGDRHLAHALQPSAAGAEAIVEWFRSTGLKPYLDPLDEAEQADFLAAYLARIRQAYPPMSDGKVLLRFPRAVHRGGEGLAIPRGAERHPAAFRAAPSPIITPIATASPWRSPSRMPPGAAAGSWPGWKSPAASPTARM